ncbi:MAG: hypothetical protein R3F43_23485 [bacterium]
MAAGEDGRAHTVLDELLNAAQVTPAAALRRGRRRTHAPLFSSDLRTTAMALQALLAVNPEHVYVGPVVRYLLDARKAGGGYRSTQDAAWALLSRPGRLRAPERAGSSQTCRPASISPARTWRTTTSSRPASPRSPPWCPPPSCPRGRAR